MIETGTTAATDINALDGVNLEVKFNHTFKTPPKVFVDMSNGGLYWSNVQIRAESSTTGATLFLWNNGNNQAKGISITWMAIGQ